MRLCSYERSGRPSFGAVVGNDVVDVREPLAEWHRLVFADLRDFIEGGEPALARAREIAASPHAPRTSLSKVVLLAPVGNPRKVLCLGLNYRDHCKEQGVEPPANPIWFPKFANAIQRPGGPIRLPALSAKVDYEGELGVVLGRRGRDIPEEQALDYVLGYTIVHDVSARDVQFGDGQWGRAKSFDTFAPMGPVIVTRDELADPGALPIRTLINGQVMQESNTAQMIFPVPFVVAFLSRDFTFEAGDVISTGTPPGVGVFRKPPVFLADGDLVRVEIDGIGALENPVIGRPPATHS